MRGFKLGEHVGYYLGAPGAYAEQKLLPADEAIKLPRGISDEQAAAVLLKGLTAWFLVRGPSRSSAALRCCCRRPPAESD